MDQPGAHITIFYTDAEVDASLVRRNIPAAPSLHFSQNEDFFIRLPQEVEVSSFLIHHDVRKKIPSQPYVAGIKETLGQIAHQVPDIFLGMRWYFDPADVLKAGFFQILRTDETLYLVLMRIDLGFRPSCSRVISAGTNDATPTYRTRCLFVESDIIPLVGMRQNEHQHYLFQINQTVSETWIGETGRGYFIQGMWLDRDLTKFFSKLFVPFGKRTYPYFPLNCKHRAVCFQPFDLSPEGRKKALSVLHACRKILESHVAEIENVLRDTTFSEDLPSFTALKQNVSPQILAFFDPIKIRVYLNEDEFKEYELSYEKR